MGKTWKSFAGGERIPYLGVAAHDDWIAANQALIPKLYATYKAAGEYIVKHPEESALLIAPKSAPPDRAALVSLIKSNDRLGMSVVPAPATSPSRSTPSTRPASTSAISRRCRRTTRSTTSR